MNLRKLMNPSGLTQLYHSDKCDRYMHRNPGSGCICRVLEQARKACALPAILRTKEWRGSSVTPCEYKGRPANRLDHPNGTAYMYLFADVGVS